METSKKIKGHARQTTINKYNTYLKSALIKIQKDPRNFDSLDFLRQNNLTANFFRALVELKYLTSTKEGKRTKYIILVPWNNLTQEDGKRVAEYSLSYNYEHTNKLPNWLAEITECECCEVKVTKKSKLSKFTDEQLLDELRLRGYSGDINKSQIIKL